MTVVSLVVIVLNLVLCLLPIEGFQMVLGSPVVKGMYTVLVLLVVGALEVAGGSLVTERL